MNLKEFLDDNKVIKESALAVLMWPDKKNQPKVFSNKINEKIAGSGKQRITEDDEARAKSALLEVAERIKAYAGEPASSPEPIVKQSITPVKKDDPIKKPVTPIKEQPVRRNIAKELEELRNQDKK